MTSTRIRWFSTLMAMPASKIGEGTPV